jgi:uncharacterized short protein YbdD (DUF466 family)
MTNKLRTFWKWVRELTTDDAYERYLAHHARSHRGVAPLDRRSFYLREQQRKWDGVNRCC